MRRKLRLGEILVGVLVVSIAVVVGLVVIRMIIAPTFSAANSDYRYQWHRVANEQEWKDFKIKYQGSAACKDCHVDQFGAMAASVHAMIQCESCHGPAIAHPDDPKKLYIDRGRGLCLRCHSNLPFRQTRYAELQKGPIELKLVNPDEHNPGVECVNCHDPHKAAFK